MSIDGNGPTPPDALEAAEAKVSTLSLKGVEQTSTRGDGRVEPGESFTKDQIDLAAILQHAKIHQEGQVAGSQFNGEVFTGPEDLQIKIASILPENIQYDQHGRAELTLMLNTNEKPVGWTGVMTLAEIQERFPNAQIEKQVRIPGGEETVEDGVEGAWYPEMAYSPSAGRMEVVMENGQPKNARGKFEPKANIVTVPAEQFKDIAATDKITLIIQKDKSTGTPKLLTAFPGENAPAYPAKIQSESFKADTLQDPLQKGFWEQHAFVKMQ